MVPTYSRICSVLRLRAVWMLAFATGWLSLAGLASGADAEWAKWIPKEAAFVWHSSGSESQREAFEKTAAFEAYFQSGLVPTIKKFVAALPWEIIKDELAIEVHTDLTLQQVLDFYGFLYQRGFTLAVCFPEDDRGSWPYQLAVIPEAGIHGPGIGAWAEAMAAASLAKRAAAAAQEDAKPKKKDETADEADEPLDKLVKPATAKAIADNLGVDVDESAATETAVLSATIGFDKFQHQGRTIYCLHRREGHAKVDWACWQEGRDLMVYAGRPGVEVVIDKVLRGEPITASRSWQRAWTELEHPIAETAHVWCDVARLLRRYGLSPAPPEGIAVKNTDSADVTDASKLVPEPPEEITIAKLLKPLGLDGIESVAWRWGYRGRNLVDVLDVITPQPRQGLWALYDQPTVTLDRLPPLPVSLRSFSIQSFDATQTWDQFAKIISDYVALLPEESRPVIQKGAFDLSDENVAELRRELFASLGNVLCTWSDTDQELLSLGRFNLAISVKDAPALQKTLDRLFELIQQQGVEFSHTSSTRHGCPFYVFASKTAGIKPCAALCDGWLILGLQPQTVEATVLRAKGRLPRWEADVAKTTGVAIPKSFSGLTWSDPRGNVRFAMSLLPWLADLWSANAKAFAPGVDISSLDIPPAELVAQPLFPNVTTTIASPDRIRWTTWSSTPMNDSLVMLLQSYGALTVVAEMWGEDPFDFVLSLVESDPVEEVEFPADDLDDDN